MQAQETVRTLMDALQTGDFKTARALLSSDFHFSGSVPQPLGAGPWIGLCANLKTAFPNLNYHFGIQEVVDDVVHVSARLTGTHTGILNLTALNMGLLPATDTRFSMTHEAGEVTVRDQHVATWTMQSREGAGLMTLLAQITRQMPPSHRPAAMLVSRWDDALNDSVVRSRQEEVIHHA